MKALPLLAVATLLFYADSASACRITQPLTAELKSRADVVFQGTVTKYELVTSPPPAKGAEPFKFARLTFATSKTLRGEEKKEWLVNWMNGNFGVPANFGEFKTRYGTAFEVGVIKYGTSRHNSADVYKSFPDMYAKLGKYPTIVQEPCSDPYMTSLAPPNN
jgi:hypothetical protein